jgi:hypothetical protein
MFQFQLLGETGAIIGQMLHKIFKFFFVVQNQTDFRFFV